jgi:hypothetical protein
MTNSKDGKSRKSSSGPSVRCKIRGLQRLLRHQGETMTAGARVAKEAEIVSLQALADDRTRRERERELAKKYHMVKFFERRKVERRLEVLAAKAAKPGADSADLAAMRKRLDEDLFYVRNFPKDIPYVSLFPSDGHSEASRAAVDTIRARLAATPVASTADPVVSATDRFASSGNFSSGESPTALAGLTPSSHDDFFLDGEG